MVPDVRAFIKQTPANDFVCLSANCPRVGTGTDRAHLFRRDATIFRRAGVFGQTVEYMSGNIPPRRSRNTVTEWFDVNLDHARTRAPLQGRVVPTGLDPLVTLAEGRHNRTLRLWREMVNPLVVCPPPRRSRETRSVMLPR